MTSIKKKITKKTSKPAKKQPQEKKRVFSPTIDYHQELIKFLKVRKNAVEYLNTALEESLKGDEESQALFLRALKNVAEAQGSVSNLAKQAHIRRESLYRILSEKGNPEMQTLTTLLGAMGFGIHVYEIKN